MKAGKSTLAKILEDKLGLVRIKMKNLLKYAAENPFWQIESFDIEEQIRSGHPPSNAALIEIISKRIQMADC
jgi:adenylate kinase family enzyme